MTGVMDLEMTVIWKNSKGCALNIQVERVQVLGDRGVTALYSVQHMDGDLIYSPFLSLYWIIPYKCHEYCFYHGSE